MGGRSEGMEGKKFRGREFGRGDVGQNRLRVHSPQLSPELREVEAENYREEEEEENLCVCLERR